MGVGVGVGVGVAEIVECKGDITGIEGGDDNVVTVNEFWGTLSRTLC